MRVTWKDRLGRPPRPREKRNARRGTKATPGARVARWVGILLAVFVTLSLLLVLPFRWIDPPTTAFMLRDHSGRVPVDYDWHAWEELGDAAAIAVVASEDQTFASHFGFDVKSIQESVDAFGDGKPLRGASTISQQVAKNMYLWPGRSYFRKGIEAWLTVFIEVCWSKKRILEIYLNVAELGPGIYGVGAASGFFFGKAPSELNDAEAALFAAVLPNPARLQVDRPSDYVRERQRWILAQMQRLRREGWLTLMR
jgi:monofunctional biosynthetic peptidoglycan transglycosylase